MTSSDKLSVDLQCHYPVKEPSVSPCVSECREPPGPAPDQGDAATAAA